MLSDLILTIVDTHRSHQYLFYSIGYIELNIQPHLLHAVPKADPEPDTSAGMPMVFYA